MTAVVRRTLTVLVVAFGLALMHAGVGSAMACPGMDQVASMAMLAAPAEQAHSSSDAVNPVPHESGDQPVKVHSGGMCVSTPAVSSGGDTQAGASVAVLTPAAFAGRPRHGAAISTATGREPPAPDLVSVLCVIRR